jgi:hypothetical protein
MTPVIANKSPSPSKTVASELEPVCGREAVAEPPAAGRDGGVLSAGAPLGAVDGGMTTMTSAEVDDDGGGFGVGDWVGR